MTDPTLPPDVLTLLRKISTGKFGFVDIEEARRIVETYGAGGSGWQPIESAPKTPGDFSKRHYLLGWCPDDTAPDGGDCRIVWWEPHMEGGIWFGDRDLKERPTHWMPLPTPPSEEEQL